jgi:hypothetical protein
MRMMGADSVGYHERTVLGREDDAVGNALEYYASRGETPMAWHATQMAANVSCTACGRAWSLLSALTSR